MRQTGLAALLGLAACASKPAPQTADRRQTIESLTLSQSENGRPVWTLRSRLAVLREDAEAAKLDEPIMDFYRNGKVASRVTARNGKIATETHDVELSNSVMINSFEDRSVLLTDSLLYSSKKRLFHTDAEVLVRRPEGIVHGQGMQAPPDLSEIHIFHQRSVLHEKLQ